MLTPSPKVTATNCTVCGLSWEKHLTGPRKVTPTLEDCVRVLKAELATRPKTYQFPLYGYSGGSIPASFNQGALDVTRART